MLLYYKNYNINKNSYCKISLLFPEIKKSKEIYNLYGDPISSTKLSMATYFVLSSNRKYVNISISVLGFGIQFQVRE